MQRLLRGSIPSQGFASVTAWATLSQPEWSMEFDSEWDYGTVLPLSHNVSIVFPTFWFTTGPKSAPVTKRLLVDSGTPVISRSVGPDDVEEDSPNSLQIIRAKLKARGFKRINNPRRGRL
jgi:hypothetical protein